MIGFRIVTPSVLELTVGLVTVLLVFLVTCETIWLFFVVTCVTVGLVLVETCAWLFAWCVL